VTPVPRARILGVAAIAAIALAYALPLESVGCAQNSHYAAIRSFAFGVPTIDSFAQTTCDLVRANGHYYAAKAPAMDLWTAPWYRLLHKFGAVPADLNQKAGYPAAMLGVPQRAVWEMTLWAVVLPAIALLLLVWRTVERIEPGLGLASAAILGLGTLAFPFSVLLFAHVPAALFAFLSFALLFDRPSAPLWRVAAAGAAAGLAASTDLPFAVPAVALGLYAAWRHPRLQRLLAFGAGGIVGLIPVLGFNAWAFGNPFHLAYSGIALNPGAGGVEQSSGDSGFFTLHLPSFRVALELLLSQRGLFVLTPVVACGIAGCVLLWRRGFRAEAVLISVLSVVEVAWNSGHNGIYMSLGGFVPGPRFLIAVLPFLCFALAPALRRAPATVGVVAFISIVSMTVATSAEPLLGNDDTRHWLSRIKDGNFTNTVVSLAGVGHGWIAILPFYGLVLVAIAAVIAATPLRIERRDVLRAGLALVAWLLVEHAVPQVLRVDRAVGEFWGLLAAILVVAAAVWSVVEIRPEGLLVLLPLATVHISSHTKVALLLGLLALAALALTPRLRRVPGPA
jgi:hypothetical protein